MKKILITAGILLIIAAAVCIGFLMMRPAQMEQAVSYSTKKVVRGNLRSTISATGTVEPEELVNVGAQVNGMIALFGNDMDGKPVDYGSKVKAGAVLARIDDALFVADRDSNSAQVEQEKAAILVAEATLEQAKSQFTLAKQNKERADRLKPQGIVSISDYDNCQSEYMSKQAFMRQAEASVAQAKAKLTAGQAALARSQRNLEYTVIKSPVDGVIIDRRVSVGQTVNASMNAPSLFLIAKDLSRMEVWVSVNEADIGQLHPGQKAVFSVDTYPGKEFVGTVRKVRLNATMSQNIVTYVVEIYTDNSSGLLLPYLTANVKFILAERNNVLMVPNAALRFTPPTAAETVQPEPGEQFVWVLENGVPAARRVKTGLNDGSNTEILAGLNENEEVLTGTRTVSKRGGNSGMSADGQGQQTDSSNPFLPKMPTPPGAKKK